uniref:Uncharacterized protein n=1 Tax=Setaria italica TaxID=4555 RepID=K3YIM1_SETIT
MDKKPKSTCSRARGKIAHDEHEKPKSTCSRARGKIAHDEHEDGQSDKKPCSAVEDEQHSGKIGVHAIEEHKQEQGSARGDVQALLDMDDETIQEKILCLSKRLSLKFVDPEFCGYGPEYEPEQLRELYEQLALYRIRAYELTVDRKLTELDDVNLKLHYPPSKLYNNSFFEYYEDSLEWYFDLERCRNAQYDNYQRLVLRAPGYVDWDFYHKIINTYEQDQAYVQYFEEVANRTKEYICSIRFDSCFKRLDGLYFEIWKRVAKGKAADDKARQLIREAVVKIASPLKRKFYLDYARKKLEIARDIDLIPKGTQTFNRHTPFRSQ